MSYLYLLLYKIGIRFGWKLMSKTVNSSYGGTVNILKKNSFECISRTGSVVRKDSRSHKAMAQWKHPRKPTNKINSYSFDFTLSEYNESNPPSMVIVFQDWLRINPNDKDGNKPITSLELDFIDGKIRLQHIDNSYQWKGSGTPKINGFVAIEKDINYHVEIIIHDSGKASFYVDGVEISNVEYQTKSLTQWKTNSQMLGIYHTYGYDLEKELKNKISLTIENIKVKKWD